MCQRQQAAIERLWERVAPARLRIGHLSGGGVHLAGDDCLQQRRPARLVTYLSRPLGAARADKRALLGVHQTVHHGLQQRQRPVRPAVKHARVLVHQLAQRGVQQAHVHRLVH